LLLPLLVLLLPLVEGKGEDHRGSRLLVVEEGGEEGGEGTVHLQLRNGRRLAAWVEEEEEGEGEGRVGRVLVVEGG